VTVSSLQTCKPTVGSYKSNISLFNIISTETQPLNKWFHLAITLQYPKVIFYNDGTIIGQVDGLSSTPNNILRAINSLGRSSNWPNDADCKNLC